MQLPFLDALEENWQPVSKAALLAWLVFYGLFLVQAFYGRGLAPLMDLVFVPIHEGGHLLFGWLGQTLGVAGGTILQLFVPLALATYFALQRQIPGTAFCVFFFFEQFLPVATYMADARRQELPLVTVGSGEYTEHDWFVMFSKLGVLECDTRIAGTVRALGWLGMLGAVAWFAWRARRSQPDESEA